MKRILPLLPMLLLACSVGAQTAPPGHTPLRPTSECPRIDRINEWHVVDARTAIVRTGPDRYLVTLQADCPRLGIGNPGLLFRANESNRAVDVNRICGEVGETVQARYQPPCPIASVTRIPVGRFDDLRKQAQRHGSGADQPSQP